MPYEMILTEKRGSVGLVTLNRPEARNALNNQLLHELMDALEAFDNDGTVGALVVTGVRKRSLPVRISRRWPGRACAR